MSQAESKITHPHDKFCRLMISDPDKAGTLLRERLPTVIANALAPDLPALVEGSFVDETLRDQLSDRLFLVQTIHGTPAFIYVLIDHKSSPDRLVAWQLLRYMIEIWKQWERENENWQRLPPIIPLILYHGKAGWHIPDEFLALVDADAGWESYLLNFRFTLMNLGKIPDQQLSHKPKLRVWLLALKYATREKQQQVAKPLLIEALSEAPDELPYIFRYLVETYDTYDEQTLREIVKQVRPEEEIEMMSQFAQENIRIGRQDGIQIGKKDGESSVLLRLLHRRFPALPSWVEPKVQTAELNKLEEWADRILDARSLQDIFGEEAITSH